MPDLFGKKQLGRATTGGRFYATPSERVEAGAVYFPDESSLLFGVAEYTVEAGNLGAFATEGTFVFEKPNDWIDAVGRKVFFRPSTGEIVNQDKKGDVLIGFQVLANVPNDKLGVLLTSGEFSVVIYVTSTADSGAGSLRQALADAQDGDVILFDSDVFPAGQTTAILLSSYLTINKSISIYGGEADGAGGYTSGATKEYYVYREIEGVKTKTYIDDDNPAQEGETVLFENVCRVALDGQETVYHFSIAGAAGDCIICGLSLANGYNKNGGSVTLHGGDKIEDCNFYSCVATGYGGAVYAYNATAKDNNIVDNCSFASCNAANGGAFASSAVAATVVNNSAIDGCTATGGGGVYSRDTSANIINACKITNCSASYGGGVYARLASQNTLNGCQVTNCTATSNGGGVYSYDTSQNTLNNCIFDASSTVYIASTSALTITGGITTIAAATLGTATITIADGAALTITTSATIGAATFTSDGRGYLATAAGIDITSATLTNVVLCSYGAGLESFAISEDGASWTAEDLTTPILLEQKGDGATWTTLSDDATGGSYSDTFEIGTTLRAFDGVRFLVASLDAYWQVEPFVVASNGGGGAGDVSPSWTISDATITPNVEEV